MQQPSRPPRSLLHLSQAEGLRRLLQSEATSRLPSISVLARQRKVSYQTMRKAVHCLIDEGVAAFGPGKRIVAAGSAEARKTAGSHLAALLATRIREGVYKLGDRLPKIRRLMLEEHVSSAVVSAAFADLVAQGMVHKTGKFWFAGPERASVRTSFAGVLLSQTSPVIVTVAPSRRRWNLLFSGDHIIPFSSALNGELLSHGMQLRLAVNVGEDQAASPVLPTGMDAVLSLIRSLGTRYWGTLLLHSPEEAMHWPHWVDQLLKFDRPVVYFNYSGDDDDLYSRPRHAKYPFYRLFMDEAAAVSLALDQVAGLGHRRIGVPIYDTPDFPWPKRRLALMRLVARRRHPELTITDATHTEEFWDFEQYSALTDFTRTVGPELGESDGPAVRRSMTLRDRLLHQTPSLTSLLEDATVLFALNDRFARGYYLWCRAAGIEVPRDLSMVSFDNIPDSVALPISTVDFGFSRLGYLAAHALIGDIPVESRMGGKNIAGECTLIDRGSLARPRRGRSPLAG